MTAPTRSLEARAARTAAIVLVAAQAIAAIALGAWGLFLVFDSQDDGGMAQALSVVLLWLVIVVLGCGIAELACAIVAIRRPGAAVAALAAGSVIAGILAVTVLSLNQGPFALLGLLVAGLTLAVVVIARELDRTASAND